MRIFKKGDVYRVSKQCIHSGNVNISKMFGVEDNQVVIIDDSKSCDDRSYDTIKIFVIATSKSVNISQCLLKPL